MTTVKASLDAKRNSYQRLDFQYVFWAFIAFTAAQRFGLPGISGLICLIPFVAALTLFNSNQKTRNTLLFLALFCSIDHAVAGSGSTPAFVRYLIYGTAILTLVLNSSIRWKGLIGTIAVSIFYMATTIVHADNPLSLLQLWRDLQILLLGGLLFSLKKRRGYEIDIRLLSYAITGYVISECVNFIFFKGAWYGEYMSYNTTKCLVVMPSLVALLVGRPLLAGALIGLTIMVLVGYTHRTLLLAYLMSVGAILALLPMRHGFIKRLYSITGIGLTMLIFGSVDYATLLEGSKALNTFNILRLNGLQALEILDPVRFASSAMFFDLPLFDLLFGRGLGSGIYDANGLLSFVRPDQTAFTARELHSGYFYGFHDVWVDVGLRFGLLPFALFVVWLIRLRPVGNHQASAIWVLALMAILSAFYSTSGLVSIAVLIRVIQAYQTSVCPRSSVR
jgi:hypothetical protein